MQIFYAFLHKNLVNSKKSSTFAAAFEGKMAEWSIASVLKTEVLKGTGGSNPSLSAKITSLGVFFAKIFAYIKKKQYFCSRF